MSLTFEPIGLVVGGRGEAFDDGWDAVSAAIELDAARFAPESVAGLADFSHLEVVYHFHRVPEEKVQTGARHPRNRADWPLVGIFAQRGKNRPNRIGSTICRVLRREGTRLRVAELDAIEGTPVLDLKPVMREFLPREDVRQPRWSHELMARYWNV
jgi:tRNA (Thr-GGU) A37 N-methylase